MVAEDCRIDVDFFVAVEQQGAHVKTLQYIERLVPLGRKQPFDADRRARAPFAAVAVEAEHHVFEFCRIVAAAVEVVFEPERELDLAVDIFGRPCFHRQDIFSRFLSVTAVDFVEQGQVVNRRDIALDRRKIGTFALFKMQTASDRPVVEPCPIVNTHRIDDRAVMQACDVVAIRQAIGGVLSPRRLKLAQGRFSKLLCSFFAFGDNDGKRFGIERRNAFEVGGDQDIAFFERSKGTFDVLSGQDVRQLFDDRQKTVVLPVLVERRADIDGDDDIDVHLFLHHIHGKVVGDAAVDECPAVDFDGFEHAGNADRRVDGTRQRTVRQSDRIAVFQIRRYGAKGNRKRVEIADVRHGKGFRFQQFKNVLALEESRSKRNVALRVDAKLKISGKRPLQLLAAKRNLFAVVIDPEIAPPVGLKQHFLDRPARHPRGVEAADERTHARTCDGVDRDMVLFEDLDHTEVRTAARAAAAEHQADFRARLRRRRRQQHGQHRRKHGPSHRPYPASPKASASVAAQTEPVKKSEISTSAAPASLARLASS